jgi:hypothetical protein
MIACYTIQSIVEADVDDPDFSAKMGTINIEAWTHAKERGKNAVLFVFERSIPVTALLQKEEQPL